MYVDVFSVFVGVGTSGGFFYRAVHSLGLSHSYFIGEVGSSSSEEPQKYLDAPLP